MSRPFRASLPGALLVFLLFLSAAPASAQHGGALSSFPLLQMESSTRAAGLGGAFSAVQDGRDASSLFYQPAGPSEQSHNALAVNYLNHLSDLNAGFIAFNRHVEGVGTASAGLRFFSYGRFDGRDADGYETGDFGASDVALTLGLARALGTRWRYGASVHAVYGSLDDAGATALAADLGVLYHLDDQDFTLSASVHQLGGAVDPYYGDGDNTALPMDFRLGISKRLAHLPLRFSATGFSLHDFSTGGAATEGSTFDDVMRHLALGAELEPVDVLALRVGYGHHRHEELRDTDSDARVDPAGLSAGFGLSVQRISVDYAFSSWSAIGGLHQLGLRARL